MPHSQWVGESIFQITPIREEHPGMDFETEAIIQTEEAHSFSLTIDDSRVLLTMDAEPAWLTLAEARKLAAGLNVTANYLAAYLAQRSR